jgi:hypothetical protein
VVSDPGDQVAVAVYGGQVHGRAEHGHPAGLVAMACELLPGMQMLALDSPARAWEPKRLRLRLFSAGRLTRGGRRLRLRIAAAWSRAPSSPPRRPRVRQ